MAALSRTRKAIPRRRRGGLWFERIMAVLALINLILVIGDLSYLRFRDQYLKSFPELTRWYGETYKGIEPERATTAYLETVERLEEQVSQTGLQSIQAETILADLQAQSVAIIDENPFQIANKSGTLERIKNDMRERVDSDSASSKEAFETFWSQTYLSENGWTQEIDFFNAQLRPQFETNYFRRIDFDGAPLDWFWRIDIWFIAIFGLELLARTFYLSRRYKNLTWLDAILWRWYDLLLIIPFSAIRLPWLALLRVIPVGIRLNQSRTVNLEPFLGRINRFFISQIAVELTEVVVLRIIDQTQNLIREGEVSQWLFGTANRQYIGVNDVNEIQVISQRLTSVLVYQVMPKLKPELDALLHHSVTSVLHAAPAYGVLRQLPGIGSLPDQLAQQMVAQVSQTAYGAIRQALEDEQGARLMSQLLSKLLTTFKTDVQQDDTVPEIEMLTVALLEEIKLNYVKRLAAEDVEQLAEQRYRLYDVTQEGNS